MLNITKYIEYRILNKRKNANNKFYGFLLYYKKLKKVCINNFINTKCSLNAKSNHSVCNAISNISLRHT